MKRRPGRISFFAASITALVAANAILLACSSSDNTAAPAPVEAGPDVTASQRDAPAPDDDSAADDAAPACSPHALTTPLKWHPPRPFNTSACTPAQINGFVQSCILGSHAVCDAFRMQNQGCAACAYTSADDATWGAVVDNRSTAYIQLNEGGCIAEAAGETDETGCGGAFQLYAQCQNQACAGCFPIKSDVKALSACKADPQTDTICAAYLAQGNVKCPKGGTPSTQKCFFSGTSFADNVQTYLSFWCSTGPDGGTDAGDAAPE